MVDIFIATEQGIAQLPDFLVQDLINNGKLVSILETFAMAYPDVSGLPSQSDEEPGTGSTARVLTLNGLSD